MPERYMKFLISLEMQEIHNKETFLGIYFYWGGH